MLGYGKQRNRLIIQQCGVYNMRVSVRKWGSAEMECVGKSVCGPPNINRLIQVVTLYSLCIFELGWTFPTNTQPHKNLFEMYIICECTRT
jgi:hypothetical protein